MLRSFISSSCLAGMLVACASAGTIEGNGTMKEAVRQVPAFTAVDLSGDTVADIQCQQPQSLKVSADENLLPLWETDVKDGVLMIRPKDKQNLHGTQPLKVTITVPDVAKVSASGAATVTVNGSKSPALTVHGAGASTFHLVGAVQDLTLDGSGATNFDAARLKSVRAKVDLSGAGQATVHATDTLNVAISGVGKVEYIGNPKVTKQISGMGTVAQKSP